MKPRIRKICGIWYCGFACDDRKYDGIGYTPKHAYQDWKAATFGRAEIN